MRLWNKPAHEILVPIAYVSIEASDYAVHTRIERGQEDPLENHKATRPAFNAGPVSALQRNAI